MAVADTTLAASKASSWNPLRVTGTVLPPNVLLMAKLLVLYRLVQTRFLWLPEAYLPFLPFLDVVRGVEAVSYVSGGIFLVSAILLLFNRWPRAAALVCGVLILISILANRTVFSNNLTLIGCLLVLIGLQSSRRTSWLLRAQIVLVYFGAGLNKLLDPDWRNGQFVEFWTHDILHHTLYMEVASLLPPMLLSQMLGWITICIELGLATAFFVPQWWRAGIALGMFFHLGILVFTGGVLSVVFLYVMLTSYLTFFIWPDDKIIVRFRSGQQAWFWALLRATDADEHYQWRREQGKSSLPAVSIGQQMWYGWRAVVRLLMYHPLTYFMPALLVLAYQYGYAHLRAIKRLVYLLAG